jgi:hypothetical protein
MDPQTIFSRNFFYFNLIGIDLYPSGVRWKKYLMKFAFFYFLGICFHYFLFGGYLLLFTVYSMETFIDAVECMCATIDTTVKLINYGFIGGKCCNMIDNLMALLNEGFIFLD